MHSRHRTAARALAAAVALLCVLGIVSLASAPGAAAAAPSPAPRAGREVAAPSRAPQATGAAQPHAVVCTVAVTIDSTTPCALPSAGSARFTFHADGPDRIRFRAAIPAAGETRVSTLSSSDGTQLCASSGFGFGSFDCALPAAGDYRLDVALDSAQTVYATIDSVLSRSCAGAPNTAVGQPATDITTTDPGASYCEQLTAATGDVFTLNLDTNGDEVVDVEVYDAAGAVRCAATQVSSFGRTTCALGSSAGSGFRLFVTPDEDSGQQAMLMVTRVSSPVGCGHGAPDAFGATPSRRGALAAHQQRCFAFMASAAEHVGVHLLATLGPPGYLSWTVRGADGASLCAGAVGVAIDTCALPAAGSYTLFVGSLARTSVRWIASLTNLSDGSGCVALPSTAWGAPAYGATLSANGQVDCQTFTTSGSTVRVNFYDQLSNVTKGVLVRADGTTVCTVYGRLDCNGGAAGTYRLIVSTGVQATDSYQVWATDLSSDAGCTATAPDVMGSAPTRSAQFSTTNVAQCWQLTVPAGASYFVRPGSPDGAALPSLAAELRSLDGTWVCTQQAGGSCTPPAPGEYLLVLRFDGVYSYYSATASVGLWRLDRVTNCARTPTSFTAAPTTGYLGSALELDCAVFSGSPGDRLFVNTTPSTVIQQRIVDSHGIPICYGGSPCVLTGSGPYHVLTFGSQPHNYAFRVANLTAAVGCSSMPVKQFGAAPGRAFSIASAASLQCFTTQLFAVAGGRFAVRMVNNSSTQYGATVTVFAPDLQQACTAFDDAAECLSDGPGRYLVVVTAPGPLTGTLGLFDYTTTAGCRAGPSGAFGAAPTPGRIYRRGAIDCVSLPFAARQKTRFAFAPRTDGPTLLGEVVDGQGRVLCTVSNGADCALPASASTPIRLLVHVPEWASSFTGDYRVHAWRLDSATGCTDLGSLADGFGPIAGTLRDGADEACYLAQSKANGVLDANVTNDDDPAAPPYLQFRTPVGLTDGCHSWPNPGCVLPGGPIVIFVVPTGGSTTPVHYHAEADCISSTKCGP